MYKVYIYGLLYPDTLDKKYVGQTQNIKQRFASHLCEHKSKKSKSKKDIWIESLLNSGKKPIIIVLDSCIVFDGNKKEQYYIELYRDSVLNNGKFQARGGSKEMKIKKITLDKWNRIYKALKVKKVLYKETGLYELKVKRALTTGFVLPSTYLKLSKFFNKQKL